MKGRAASRAPRRASYNPALSEPRTDQARAGLGAAQIGEELIVDIERYRSHPDCDAIVALVYDPEKRIPNQRTLETDLSGERDGLIVRVVVVQ
ncbi:MAG TPA: hypothetical protein VIL73_01490 [Gaiellaceae bacterium]|jgi:hypothetical protein